MAKTSRKPAAPKELTADQKQRATIRYMLAMGGSKEARKQIANVERITRLVTK